MMGAGCPKIRVAHFRIRNKGTPEMLSIMSYHLNKQVLVSIPEILGDGEPRRCRLTGVEPFGLWLESEDLSRIAFSSDERPLAMVFVPFTQIGYLVAASAAPPPAAIADPVVESPPQPRRASPVMPKAKRP
jgi:hypothetical protein